MWLIVIILARNNIVECKVEKFTISFLDLKKKYTQIDSKTASLLLSAPFNDQTIQEHPKNSQENTLRSRPFYVCT